VVIDAVIRLLPGAIDAASTAEESFVGGLLEYPQYTPPAVFRGIPVPTVLVSGNHGAVRRWRLRESLRRTLHRRPDLIDARRPGPDEASLLAEIRAEANPTDAAPDA
jgi:tRNA (guanine37-N1)-methyltransferase